MHIGFLARAAFTCGAILSALVPAGAAWASVDPFIAPPLSPHAEVVPWTGYESFTYGPEGRHRIRFDRPRPSTEPPLVVLIPDTGWTGAAGSYPLSYLRPALRQNGFAWAEIRYSDSRRRMLDVSVSDVVLGLQWLRFNAAKLGFDPDTIVLFGSGPGAQIATLIGTDLAILGDEALARSIKGIVSVNGEGFDLTRLMGEVSTFRRGQLQRTFGNDPDYYRRYSPERHAALPNAPAFLFQSVDDHPILRADACRMQLLLAESGTPSSYAPLGKWMMDLPERYYGAYLNPGFERLLAFLRTALAIPNGGVKETETASDRPPSPAGRGC